MSVRILHKGCGGHLFDYAERPVWQAVVLANKATLRDGTRPARFTFLEILCERCGQTVTRVQDLEPEGGFAEPH